MLTNKLNSPIYLFSNTIVLFNKDGRKILDLSRLLDF